MNKVPDFLPPFLELSDTAAEKLFALSGFTMEETHKAKGDDFQPIDLKQNGTIVVKLKKAKGAG